MKIDINNKCTFRIILQAHEYGLLFAEPQNIYKMYLKEYNACNFSASRWYRNEKTCIYFKESGNNLYLD